MRMYLQLNVNAHVANYQINCFGRQLMTLGNIALLTSVSFENLDRKETQRKINFMPL